MTNNLSRATRKKTTTKETSAKRRISSQKARVTEIIQSVVSSRNAIEKREKGVRRLEYEAVQRIAEYAEELSNSKTMWARFVADPYWQRKGARPKLDGRKKALRYLLRIHCKNDYNASSLRRIAVEWLLLWGTKVSDLATTIEEFGGWKAVTEARQDMLRDAEEPAVKLGKGVRAATRKSPVSTGRKSQPAKSGETRKSIDRAKSDLSSMHGVQPLVLDGVVYDCVRLYYQSNERDVLSVPAGIPLRISATHVAQGGQSFLVAKKWRRLNAA